ncbi:MAG: hypothetical protein LBU17_07500 [Treponema sp.]|jgi:hypothetical protein|nr:hypothetical protein [Treponema sp.]
MDTAFQEIITHIMTDYGIAVFNQVRYKALLLDYAKGEFKKERRLLLQVLEAGCHRKIRESRELPITRNILVRDLQDDYYITQSDWKQGISD